MTQKEWENQKFVLECAITKAKACLVMQMTLAQKIEKKQKVKEAEKALQQHKLNYYELIAK